MKKHCAMGTKGWRAKLNTGFWFDVSCSSFYISQLLWCGETNLKMKKFKGKDEYTCCQTMTTYQVNLTGFYFHKLVVLDFDFRFLNWISEPKNIVKTHKNQEGKTLLKQGVIIYRIIYLVRT